MYGGVLVAPPGAPQGESTLVAQAVDSAGHTTMLPLGTITLLLPPTVNAPAGLPPYMGWGTNGWISADGGKDWQVNTGVPFDYLNQYINYGVPTSGKKFVSQFVNYAWDHHYVPVVTVYLLKGLPPTCGEGPDCYIPKLQNKDAISLYLADFEQLLVELRGTKPVIIQIEPDFMAYMQMYTNQTPPPPGARPDDPSSIRVALGKPGYADTLAGFGSYLVDRIHTSAPNALAAHTASKWAAGNPQIVSTDKTVEQSQRTARFLAAAGGSQADLLVTQWSDRDAGSGLKDWWDVENFILPRPTRAFLWENALTREAGKPLLLWQIPAGNMNLDNTYQHYQDNRAAYLFDHPQDAAHAGIIGVSISGGDISMTQVYTDGGQVASQAAVQYAPPAAPSAFTLVDGKGAQARFNWAENTEIDLAGYILSYSPVGSQLVFTQDAGLRNTQVVFFNAGGDWKVCVQAYDAMRNRSACSNSVVVTATSGASQLFLPYVTRPQP